MNKKLILFGGSFDPPHLAHLIIAQYISELLKGPVRFLPAGNPPHKTPLSSGHHRLEMLRLATAGNPNFLIDDYELNIKEFTFTAHTLERFSREYSVDRDSLYFIVGSDSFNALMNWRNPQEILRLSTLVVYRRDPVCPETMKVLKEIGGKIVLCEAPVIQISSSCIRLRAAQGKPIDYLVPRDVKDYIVKTGLYIAGNQAAGVEKDNNEKR